MTRLIDLETDPFGFGDLEDPIVVTSDLEPPVAPVRKTYPCQKCGGRGLWSGGYNRNGQSKCFKCDGRGYFLTSQEDRTKRAEAKKVAKVNQVEAALETFSEEYPDVMADFLGFKSEVEHGTSNLSAFVQSLVAQLFTKGFLTEKQVYAYRAGKARFEERKAQIQNERKSVERAVDLSNILAMFNKARESLKKPAYRAQGLVLTPPAAHSPNAGGIYVKSDKQDYYGKVMGGTFMPARDLRGAELDRVTNLLTLIAANPREAAVQYGRETGTCACCGRTLTDPTSVALGIGPICIENWGF